MKFHTGEIASKREKYGFRRAQPFKIFVAKQVLIFLTFPSFRYH